MKKKVSLFIFFLLLFVGQGFAQTVRAKLNFNRDWKFKLGDQSGGEATVFNDSDWESVGLPHSFSIPYFMSPDFYVGYGWYRKRFDIPSTYAGKRINIEFEGAFQDAEIFVNNKKAGSHKGGYTGFSIDITKFAREGENLIAVRLNNLWNPQLAPRAGEHVFSGGLYRDVYLVVTDPVHVAWYGTSITSPHVSAKEATVNIATEVENNDDRPRSISLKTDIISPTGKVVASLLSKQVVKSGQTALVNQLVPNLKNPALWHPAHPNLYKAVSTLFDGNKQLDRYETKFGIRSVRWTADKGFFLNGEKFYLLGANVHQDHAGWGDAVSNSGFLRDVKMIKEAGFNFIRGSHYPHDPAFANACDQEGLLLWPENAFWGIGGFISEGYWNSSAYPTRVEDRAGFDASVLQQLREMIRIFRNNPSVIVWSMSNEPFFTHPSTIEPMRELLKKTVELAHKLDPSRAAAIGGAQRPLDKTRIDILGDVAGYNGDGASISVFQNPGIPTVVSEYGSTTADRPGKYEPGFGDIEKDNGKPVHDWRSGQAIWCGFDHGSIAGEKLGKMGIVDYFRIPKRAWYWYRNQYSKISPPEWPQHGTPAGLKLEADTVVASSDGTEDIKLLVTVVDEKGKPLSNNPPVQLAVISGPGEFPTGNAITFEEGSDISIIDGKASIEIRSWYAGESTIRATSPGLPPSDIKVRFTGAFPFIDGVSGKVQNRPYKRFDKKAQQTSGSQKFGRYNPTFASTSLKDHPAGYGADGNSDTWWQPLANDTFPSWMLDTEKKLVLSEIDIKFPKEDIYKFKVEISENRQDWKLIADFTDGQKRKLSEKIKVDGMEGRFVKITFVDASNAMLKEIEVTGMAN